MRTTTCKPLGFKWLEILESVHAVAPYSPSWKRRGLYESKNRHTLEICTDLLGFPPFPHFFSSFYPYSFKRPTYVSVNRDPHWIPLCAIYEECMLKYGNNRHKSIVCKILRENACELVRISIRFVFLSSYHLYKILEHRDTIFIKVKSKVFITVQYKF